MTSYRPTPFTSCRALEDAWSALLLVVPAALLLLLMTFALVSR